MMKKAPARPLRPKAVRVSARLVHAVADRGALGVAVLVERFEVRDHAVPGLGAEPARDLDLPCGFLLAFLRDRSRHARQRRDLGVEVDEDVGEALLLVLLVDDLLPVLAQDRLARIREDSGVPPDLVGLGSERRVHLREPVVRDDSFQPLVGVLGEDPALRQRAPERALDLLERIAQVLHAREGEQAAQVFLNALPSAAGSTATLSIIFEPPTEPAPSDVRPVLSVSRAILKPWPFSPMRFAAGTRQFSEMIWHVEDAQRPSFFSSAPRERPGRVPSSFAMTTKQEISLCFSFSGVSEGT